MNDIDYAETDQEEELEKYKKRFVIKHWIVTILLLVVVACFSSEITQIYGLIIDKSSVGQGMHCCFAFSARPFLVES